MTSLCLVAVAVRRVIGLDEAIAVHLKLVLALVAGTVTAQAGVSLSADTDEVANLDVTGSFGADADGAADNLVADNEGEFGVALGGRRWNC